MPEPLLESLPDEQVSHESDRTVNSMVLKMKAEVVYLMELRRRKAVLPALATMDEFVVPEFDEETMQIVVCSDYIFFVILLIVIG